MTATIARVLGPRGYAGSSAKPRRLGQVRPRNALLMATGPAGADRLCVQKLSIVKAVEGRTNSDEWSDNVPLGERSRWPNPCLIVTISSIAPHNAQQRLTM